LFHVPNDKIREVDTPLVKTANAFLNSAAPVPTSGVLKRLEHPKFPVVKLDYTVVLNSILYMP
jgi:hypothetical protein